MAHECTLEFSQTFFSSTENHLISLLWLLNEFPILFQRWLIIPSAFFNMWNFRDGRQSVTFQFRYIKGSVQNNWRKSRVKPQEIGTSFLSSNFVIYYRKFYKKKGVIMCKNVALVVVVVAKATPLFKLTHYKRLFCDCHQSQVFS